MKDDYQIHLNFLPVDDEPSSFIVHRKPRAPEESRPSSDVIGYRLPITPNSGGDWSSYWVSIDPVDGFEAIEASPRMNPDLTCRVLFWCLVTAAKGILQPNKFHIPENSFIEEVSFIQRTHPEGDE